MDDLASDEDYDGLIVGESRLLEGKPAMFIGYRSYGGGEGPLWAIVGQAVEFTITRLSRGYLRGWVRAIHPDRKSITLEIVQGMTWGVYAEGTQVEIPAEQIGRFHKVTSEFDLVQMSREMQAEAYAKEQFVAISARELAHWFAAERDGLLAGLIGQDELKRCEIIGQNLGVLVDAMVGSRGLQALQPSKKIRSAARRIRQALDPAIAP